MDWTLSQNIGLPKEIIMAELQLTLSAEERECLVGLLETTLKNTRVEEHRTRTPSYREFVVHNEELIKAVLSKLGKTPS